MKKIKQAEVKAGIWLDHKVAVIVKIKGDENPELIKIRSGMESRIRVPGEGKVFARFGNSFLDDQEKKQRRQQNKLKHYYKEITVTLQDADYLWIFGPGNAKDALNNQIEKDSLVKAKVVALDTSDKMTLKMIVTSVSDYFNSDIFKLFKRNQKRLLKGKTVLADV